MDADRSTVICDITSRYGSSSVVYFYFDFKDITKQDVLGLASSLVLQTIQNMDSFPSVLLDLFRRHSLRDAEHPSLPTTSELLDIFITLTNMQHTSFVVIDALDECREKPALLAFLAALIDRANPRSNMLWTSRWEVDIQDVTRKLGFRGLEIEAHQVHNDVSLYVQKRLESDERLRQHRPAIQALILEKLCHGAQGM